MNFVISLSPIEEARLSEAATRIGMAPADLVKRLAFENLPAVSSNTEIDLDVKLRLWQQHDGTPLVPDVPTTSLFDRWAAEDARMTTEDRDAEDRLWRRSRATLMPTNGCGCEASVHDYRSRHVPDEQCLETTGE